MRELQRSPGNGQGITRLDRLGTLLLASAALTVLAFVGWGGPLVDLRLPAELVARALTAGQQGLPIGPAVLPVLARLRPDDLWPLAGNAVTLLLGWHVLSCAAEVALVLADGLGWLEARWLYPLWRLLDVLDSGPLARPKRIVVAGALATQVLARSAVATHAAPLAVADPPALVDQRPAAPSDGQAPSPEGPPPPPAQAADRQTARAWLVYRVHRGDTLRGLGRRFYGSEEHWVTLFQGNVGAVMGWADLGRGHPIRLTNPNYVLAGCDLVIPPVPGRLEMGPNGEVIYVVQRGDMLGRIAERFGVSLRDLWATNRGAAAPDGRLVEDPDLIWPGVRIQISPLAPAAPPEAEPAPAEQPAPTPQAAPEPDGTPTPTPLVPSAAVPTATAAPTPAPTAPAEAPIPTVPPAIVPPAATPTGLSAPEVPPPPAWPVLPLVVGAGLAGAAAWHLRRRRLFETDLTFTAGRVAARPARAFQAHSVGDPTELAAAALVRMSVAHGIADVQTVAVYRDPTEITVVLGAPAAERDRLRLLLAAGAAPLARRASAWLTADRDVAVRLEGPRPEALATGEEVPLLLSIGGLGDGRELLAGWETLGHLLVASGPGTDDAPVQLAATVAMLAACRGADRLQVYTACAEDSPLAPLAALPQQRALATSAQAAHQVLAALDRALDGSTSEERLRVLVLGELAALAADEQAVLGRLLAQGPAHGLRVLAATTDPAAAADAAPAYLSRVVYAMPDEETSVRVLGSPEAAGLAAGGGMLIRLGGRAELIEAYQLRVPDEDLAALLAAMAATDQDRATSGPSFMTPQPSDAPDLRSEVSHDAAAPSAAMDPVASDGVVSTGTPDRTALNGTDVDAAVPVRGPNAVGAEPVLLEQPTGALPADAAEAQANEADRADEPVLPPLHIARLLARAEPGQVVLQCLGGLALWAVDGRGQARWAGPGSGAGQLRLTRQVDLLAYVAVHTVTGTPLSDDEPTGVAETEARADLWHDTASRPIVRITAGRLMDDLARIGLSPRAPLLRVERGRVVLDQTVCVTDLGAFQQAAAAARVTRGPDALAAAEAAVAACGGPLLDGVLAAGGAERKGALPAAPARRGRPSDAPLLGWTEEFPARRVAGQLEALYRQALALLAARLREAGRPEDALERAWQALRAGEPVPPDDAERLAVEVLEAAAALRGGARLRTEYATLERHLHRRGLELTEHLQLKQEQLLRVLAAASAEHGSPSSRTRGEPVERAFERR